LRFSRNPNDLHRKACDSAEIQMSCLEKLAIQQKSKSVAQKSLRFSRNPNELHRKPCDLAEIQMSCVEKFAIQQKSK
jgi:hypothetical protein